MACAEQVAFMEDEKCIQDFGLKLQWQRPFGRLGIDDRIILK
jgi:hypothetical protein